MMHLSIDTRLLALGVGVVIGAILAVVVIICDIF